MKVNINKSWATVLREEFDKPYFYELAEFIRLEYQKYQCHPMGKDIFSAFNRCAFDDVKVVIIGQDPYHGIDQAHGLCFSVHEGTKHPPSLINIFKELQNDIGKEYPVSG